MSEQTVGEYLKEKLTNMAKWVKEETGEDMTELVISKSDVEIACVIGKLSEVPLGSWSELCRLVPDEFMTPFDAVRNRPEMHEKFWRYIRLFVVVISN